MTGWPDWQSMDSAPREDFLRLAEEALAEAAIIRDLVFTQRAWERRGRQCRRHSRVAHEPNRMRRDELAVLAEAEMACGSDCRV